VLVAVDAGGSTAALREAADVAVRRHVPVHVLHVASWTDSARHRAEHDQVLRTAVTEVTALVDGAVHVTGELAYGDAVGRIVASGRASGLTVVQRGAAPERGRTKDLQIGAQVAALTSGAVLVVPWPWGHRAPSGVVVVGLPDTGPGSTRLLVLAADAAAGAGASLRVVHAVPVETTDEQLAATRDRVATLVAGSVGPVAAGQDGVDVVRGRAGDVLGDAAALADLLVVGRTPPPSVVEAGLGSVTRSLVTRASCPVLIAPALAGDSSSAWSGR
jgi:nucleotide-binding universal stress UspA family protein